MNHDIRRIDEEKKYYPHKSDESTETTNENVTIKDDYTSDIESDKDPKESQKSFGNALKTFFRDVSTFLARIGIGLLGVLSIAVSIAIFPIPIIGFILSMKDLNPTVGAILVSPVIFGMMCLLFATK